MVIVKTDNTVYRISGSFQIASPTLKEELLDKREGFYLVRFSLYFTLVTTEGEIPFVLYDRKFVFEAEVSKGEFLPLVSRELVVGTALKFWINNELLPCLKEERALFERKTLEAYDSSGDVIVSEIDNLIREAVSSRVRRVITGWEAESIFPRDQSDWLI